MCGIVAPEAFGDFREAAASPTRNHCVFRWQREPLPPSFQICWLFSGRSFGGRGFGLSFGSGCCLGWGFDLNFGSRCCLGRGFGLNFGSRCCLGRGFGLGFGSRCCFGGRCLDGRCLDGNGFWSWCFFFG